MNPNVDPETLITIADNWANFERVDVPTNASEAQRQVMKQSFYAGAASMTMLAARAMSAPDPVAAFQMLAAELKAYAAVTKASFPRS